MSWGAGFPNGEVVAWEGCPPAAPCWPSAACGPAGRYVPSSRGLVMSWRRSPEKPCLFTNISPRSAAAGIGVGERFGVQRHGL